MWPVDAVVGEKAPSTFSFRKASCTSAFWKTRRSARKKRARLDGIARRILAEVPDARSPPISLTGRPTSRSTTCEDVPPLAFDAAERIAELMRDAGLNAKISSIHVNGWFGGYDKLTTTRILLTSALAAILAWRQGVRFRRRFAKRRPDVRFFQNSVGVANVRRFEGRLAASPKYVTGAASGAGFVELAEHLLQGQ